MARFIAYIQGNRREVSKLGDTKSGITAEAQGFKTGARIRVYVNQEGKDEVLIFMTGGTDRTMPERIIARFTENQDIPTLIP